VDTFDHFRSTTRAYVQVSGEGVRCAWATVHACNGRGPLIIMSAVGPVTINGLPANGPCPFSYHSGAHDSEPHCQEVVVGLDTAAGQRVVRKQLELPWLPGGEVTLGLTLPSDPDAEPALAVIATDPGSLEAPTADEASVAGFEPM